MASRPKISHFELADVLGTGSFSTVWSAYDLRLDRDVAIKVLADNIAQNPDVRRRFMNEARVLVTAESPRLARGFEVGETDDGRPYLVMALADRGSLGERISDRQRSGQWFSPTETFSILAELARAVADVHALGHLHRDVKPNNVLIMSVPRGSDSRAIPGLFSDERVVLSDFGLVRNLEASSATLVGGSPGYVAPEQAAGVEQVDERSDLYPLGVIALEMLVGKPDRPPTSMDEASTSVPRARERLSKGGVRLPETAIELIEQLVMQDPLARPRSADEVARRAGDLAAQVGHVPASAVGAGEERVNLWGQDVRLSAGRGGGEDPEDSTLERPGAAARRQQVSAAQAGGVPVARRSIWSRVLDLAIVVGVVALIILAILLWRDSRRAEAPEALATDRIGAELQPATDDSVGPSFRPT